MGHVSIVEREGVAVLTLDRPPANAMDLALLGDLVEAVQRLASGGLGHLRVRLAWARGANSITEGKRPGAARPLAVVLGGGEPTPDSAA